MAFVVVCLNLLQAHNIRPHIDNLSDNVLEAGNGISESIRQ
jgi:hypothetical protein